MLKACSAVLLALASAASVSAKDVHVDPIKEGRWRTAAPQGAVRRLGGDGALALLLHRRDPGKGWPLVRAGGEKAMIRLGDVSVQRSTKVVNWRRGDANIVPAGDWFGGGTTLGESRAYVLEVQCPPKRNVPLTEEEKRASHEGTLSPRRASASVNLLTRAASKAFETTAEGACLRVSARRVSAPFTLSSLPKGSTVWCVLSGRGRLEKGAAGHDLAPGSVVFVGAANAALRAMTLSPSGGPLVLAEVSKR